MKGNFFKFSIFFFGIYILPIWTSFAADLPKYKPGEIIVKFKNYPSSIPGKLSPQSFNSLPSNAESLLKKYGANAVERIFPTVSSGRSVQSVNNSTATVPDLSSIAVIKFSTNSDVESLVKEFSQSTDVEYAEPNYRFELFAASNDPLYNDLWGLDNSQQSGGIFVDQDGDGIVDCCNDPLTGSLGADIKAPLAWNTTKGSLNTVVAVIDSGVNWSHPDLSVNIWRNVNEIAGNGIDDDANGLIDDDKGWDFGDWDKNPNDDTPNYLNLDDKGHGTHVAGTIGAVGNNGIGITGVSWNAAIMPLKVVDQDGLIWGTQVYQAIAYAADNSARIINLSLGSAECWNTEAIVYGICITLKDSIDYASFKGVLIVAASGNDNTSDKTQSYPAVYENVLAVAATDRNDKKADFSNYGNWVDIAAPGVAIKSTWWDGNYRWLQGTSMASPMVAGVAALVWSKYPYLTADQVRARIEGSADNIDSLNPVYAGLLGKGRVNAAKALAPDPPSGLHAESVSTNSITWRWNNSDGALNYNLYNESNGFIGNVPFNPAGNFYVQTNLSANTSHGLKVAGNNLSAEGKAAQSQNVYTLAVTPQNFALTGVGTSSATLSWNSNGNPNWTTYQIKYGTAGESTNTVTSSNLSITLTGLNSASTYFFQLKALNVDGIATSLADGVTLSTVTRPAANGMTFAASTLGSIIIFSYPTGQQAWLAVAPNTFVQNTSINLRVPTTLPPPKAASGQLKPSGMGLEIETANSAQPLKDVIFDLNYKDSDINGLEERKLVLARYDTASNLWVALPSVVDASSNRLTAATNHFSTFQIMEYTVFSNPFQVKAYPNPFMPSRGHSVMNFTQLPADAKLKIYTYSGELIRELSANSTGNVTWDGKNSWGSDVASGIYFVYIDGQGKNVIKVGIQR